MSCDVKSFSPHSPPCSKKRQNSNNTLIYKLYGKNAPPPAYALLADLQNTTAHLNNSGPTTPYRPPSDCGSGHYGSVHSSPRSYGTPPITMSSFGSPASHSTMHTLTTERYEYHHGDKGSSPIYQNQQIINEVTTTTTSSRQPVSSNLSNNLSELDTLLEDLNSARFINYADRKGSPSMNGISPPPTGGSVSPLHKPISPVGSTGSGGDRRPSVETLLDELQSAVSATHGSGSPRPTYTTQHRTETITMSTYPAPEVRGYTVHTTTAPTAAPTASSATKELDDLMASLSDFKLNANNLQQAAEQDPAYAKPQKKGTPTPKRDNQLDSMLGTLQSDMNKQGVNTTAKGHCAACNKPIVGQVVTALGKTWHPEHFVCAHCNLELGTKNFFERDGQPYCETDYHNIFSPRCAYCNGPILDKCVTALDKTWHPEHFFCSQCGRQFGEDGFHEKDGKPYCRDDYFEMFAPKCGGCNRPITENYISALNSQWHPECFVCRDCRQPFNGGSFYDHEGQPYCETHYHAKRGSLCAGCHKPITGRCITAMFRKFHPEHFVCSFCLKQLNKGTFKEQNDKPYCHACFEKLFG